ncbi:MAG: hypothetical protein HOE90_20780 [Bacteriovoracaceae bacterium]|nr:hypothetical protein [Bacteriovoracaceae bacterium]
MNQKVWFLIIFLAAAACSSNGVKGNKMGDCEHGGYQSVFPISDSAKLKSWLDHNKGRYLRLPVVVEFQDEYRLGLKKAFIGGDISQLSDDSLLLDLDDTQMGTSIIDTLKDLCPVGKNSCAVWIDGMWGRTVELPSELAVPGDTRHPFAVSAYPVLVEEKDLSALSIMSSEK